MTTLLQTIDLHCERDDRQLVTQLNLSVEPGTIHQVEGPNGSGKTTLLRVLCGLSSRFSGQILWRGQPMAQQRSLFRSQLLYLGHSAGIKAALSPRENLNWYLALKGLADRGGEQVMAALEKVGLYGYEDMACFSLSAGQHRRVALARMFLARPSLWILDEPFTAIDKQGVGELEGWISDYAQQGGSVILTTHHELAIDHDVEHLILGAQ